MLAPARAFHALLPQCALSSPWQRRSAVAATDLPHTTNAKPTTPQRRSENSNKETANCTAHTFINAAASSLLPLPALCAHEHINIYNIFAIPLLLSLQSVRLGGWVCWVWGVWCIMPACLCLHACIRIYTHIALALSFSISLSLVRVLSPARMRAAVALSHYHTTCEHQMYASTCDRQCVVLSSLRLPD